MRKFFCLWLLVLLFFIGIFTAQAQDAASLMQQADAAWLKRSASDQNAYQAIQLYQQAGQAAPNNDVPHYQIARAYYFLGRFAPAAQREQLYLKGVDAAKNALAVNANSVGGHYWYSACLARSLEKKSLFEKRKYVKDIKQHMAAALRLDPSFYFGGPPRALGMLSFKSPFGSNDDAIKMLRKSLEYAPDYSLTLVNLGEVLIKEKQYEEAKKHLQKVLTLQPMPGFERELAGDKKLAKKLLASIPE